MPSIVPKDSDLLDDHRQVQSPAYRISYFDSQLGKFAALAARVGMPTIHTLHEFVTSGGLMSYGPDLADAYRLVGMYTGQILNGEKPADLPVQQATKVELAVNLKTAKTFDLTVPQSVLGTAHEVIE